MHDDGTEGRDEAQHAAELLELGDAFRSILENMSEGVMLFDAERNLTYQNPASLRIHGFALDAEGRIRHERLPTTWNAWDEQGRPIRFDEWPVSRVFRGERFQDQVLRVERVETGKVFHGSYNGAPIRVGPDGKVTAGFITIREVTDRKRAEEALRAREAQFEVLIQELYAGVALIDARGRFTLYNRRFLDLFGLSRDADIANVNSQDWTAWQVSDEEGHLLHVDDHPVRRVALTRRPVRGQLVQVRLPGGGEARWMMVSAEPVLSDDGAIAHIICTYHDVTDLRRAEAALRDANERLRDAGRRKDEFLGMLSHELRNPLAPIRNALYILDHAQPEGQQARRAKDIATRQVAHLTRLVDDLLDVTRIARGKIELRHEDLDLAGLVRRTAEDYRPLMQDRAVELAVHVSRDPVPVNGDPARLTQILGNLLNNAAKFTPAGGRVTLSVSEEGERAVIHVRDTGAGIDPEVLPTIFEPFVQGKQTLARSEGGLGLGLALVKGLVALHGGDVTAVSGGGDRGTDVVVTLPLAPPGRSEPPPVGDRAVGRAARNRRRVLVIDDNRDAADTVAELVEMLGHTPVVAYDASTGLAKASEEAPDVVLCDIGLPGMDGYEFARRFRALSGQRAGIRLIALSGYAQPEDITKAREAGFDAHVAKPPHPDTLGQILAPS